MAAFGPFEPAPRLAVGLSGGADSLALAALSLSWVKPQGGQVTALIVDHRLRASSTVEAQWARQTAQTLGADARVLTWQRSPTASTSAAAARDARYRLLDDACRDLGLLHLLIAHHRDDNLQTVSMRAMRCNGPGLGGIPAIRELRHTRILRPTLDWPRATLRQHAEGLRTGFALDPSNRSQAYERNRLPAEPDTESSLVKAGLGRQRAEQALARHLARGIRRTGRDELIVDRAALLSVPDMILAETLRRTLSAVGGGIYPPARAATQAVVQKLREGTKVVTLCGCRIEALPTGWRVVPEASKTPKKRRVRPLVEPCFVAGPLFAADA